ncbi:hypothetical protein RclHR1_18780002 [Rhizophagus clarus]|uniref:Uncharacterized protein n=1 Tax=Rhizophagus clarus TaxID=94130 RepID=A0A2Z6QN40_9GLOM|nr:hypothetical protein RclHR1_18780002 [Rhizophagus clarus]GES94477.1 hypothetical protein RCL_jg5867.t1 [Rhizophagus clarus]
MMEMEISINQEHQLDTTHQDTNKPLSKSQKKREKQHAKEQKKILDSQQQDIIVQKMIIPKETSPILPPPASSSGNVSTSASHITIQLKDSNVNKRKKVNDDSNAQIIIGHQPDPLSQAYVKDILIYDIPAKWTNYELLQYLST